MINMNYFLAGFIGSMIGILISYFIKRKPKIREEGYLNLLKQTYEASEYCCYELDIIRCGIIARERLIENLLYQVEGYDNLLWKHYCMENKCLININKKILSVIERLEYTSKFIK